MTENDISKIIVDSALEVYRTLGGAGLLESVYQETLFWELQYRGLMVEKKLEVPAIDMIILSDSPVLLDLLIEQKIIVKVKSVVNYSTIFEAELLTNLRMMNLKLGFVINFGGRCAASGIHRVVNNL